MKNISVSFKDIEQCFLNSDAKLLSLDCFDTLYWRNVSRPFDIFTRLGHGICPVARTQAEAKARVKKRMTSGMEEVSISEIYAELDGHINPEEQKRLIEHELALEIEHGFLFPPALALLRQAKARGIRTIIVSDIYYNAEQLSRLLAAHSDEILTLIDHIYCSVDFGHGKSTKLWPVIIQHEQVQPQDIFHAGDNFSADYKHPAKLGVNAIHFKQNEAPIVTALEQRNIAANLLFPSSRVTAPIPSYFHACYSMALRNEISGTQLTAWTMLGPVMYAFARFIRQQSDRTPGIKLGFLMRDGYMPREAYQTLYPEETCASLRISRLTAICSAFHDRSSITDYLCDKLVGSERVTAAGFKMIAKHLMLSSAHRKQITAQLEKHHYSAEYLYKKLLSDTIVQETLARSAAFRRRLIAHLRNEIQLQPGDTLMFVDLGYSGTAQNLLGPLLEKELNIKVQGCYLIAGWTPGWHKNRTAMVNPATADFRLIRTLTRFIASFEMFCSSHDFSVTDYSDGGKPTGKDNSPLQHMLPEIRQLQQQALDCVRMAAEQAIPVSQSLWDSAAIDLARYLYLPQSEETDLLERMTFDVNLGTEVTQKIVDTQRALDYMRRYGVSRLTLDESDEQRTNNPSELRHHGIEYALSLFASSRYALSWSLANSNQRRQAMEVIFIANGQHTDCRTFSASSTFDGYVSLYIPLVTPELVVLAGKTLRDIEIYSVNVIEQNAIYKSGENQHSQALVLGQDYVIDGATQVNNMLLNMQDGGFIYFRLPQISAQSVLHIVYRPINEKIPGTTAENHSINAF